MLTMREKQSVSAVLRKRYRKSGKKQKGEILNEFVAITGYNRSYARRLFGSLKKRGRKRTRKPRKRVYDLEVFYPLRKIWVAADGICGQRLQPFLPELVRVLEREKELTLKREVREKLLKISSATIDRVLSVTKKRYQLKGRSTTKPGTLLKSIIPIRTFADWNENKPGFFEADLVALCGGNVKGHYVNCLNLTDVFTGWVGLEAVMGKAQSRVHDAVDRIKNRLPFPMLGLDSDNGTEFINWLLQRYCEANKITFTRIRPNRKNDNCYVEQKNYTVVRRFLGYARYDTDQQLTIIRQILRLVEIYVNFFQPVMKLTKKKRTGAKVKKWYDTAKTPYQRVLRYGILKGKKKQELKAFYESLNPLDLKRKINKLTKKLDKTVRYNLNDLTNR